MHHMEDFYPTSVVFVQTLATLLFSFVAISVQEFVTNDPHL